MSSNHQSVWLILAVLLVSVTGVSAQEELAYAEYRAIAQSAITLHHCAMFEPLEGQPGMMFVIGDKFGKLNVFWIRAGRDHERVWVSRQLEGNADEVLVAGRRREAGRHGRPVPAATSPMAREDLLA